MSTAKYVLRKCVDFIFNVDVDYAQRDGIYEQVELSVSVLFIDMWSKMWEERGWLTLDLFSYVFFLFEQLLSLKQSKLFF